MKWRDWLEEWGMTSLRIKTPFLDMEFQPQDADRAAAWELYVELLTRVATQPIDPEHGDERTALESVYSLFPISRQVLKDNTRSCTEFTKLAVVVLNQVVRPFTAKWHRLALQEAFDDHEKCVEFRGELSALQLALRKYTRMLADMAGVEDLTVLEGDET